MKTLRCTATSTLVIRALPEGGDTGKRIMHGSVVQAHGRSYDDEWLYVVAPAGEGWANANHLTEVVTPEPPLSRLWPRIPKGLKQIRETFGEPGSPPCSAGRVKLPEPLVLSWEPTKTVMAFSCHVLIAAPLESVYVELHRLGLWDLLVDFGGCYNDRTARGTTAKKSTHAWGISVDHNTRRLPLGSKERQNPRLVEVFADHGFLNGADWVRPDPQHFQRAALVY